MGDAAYEEQFGPYLVYERLGVGGMATVHRALERGVEGFERVVALKRLLPHLAEDASFIKSFVREAKLASLLTHVNIVQIYELGRVGTEYFISMEYIDGRDVRRILRHARKVTGPPPIHVTVGLMLQLCEALDYAHNKIDDEGHPLQLVHRDISPSNLLVTSSGHVKVIDFGIAKAQSSQLRTQTGRVKGKLAYMAPEAVSGSRELDARSDVWAAGVILHELLTARPLFASKNEYQTLLKVQRGDIMPPSTFNQACPPELDAIVFKALARDADDRFACAADLRDELTLVRRQYQLQTGFRDLAQWLDWAFGLDMPAGFSGNTLEPSQVSPAGRARSRPRDEDEAVELVWGNGEGEQASGPVVLDEVPDVSEKHVAPRPDTMNDGVDDDLPTPQPSLGTKRPSGPPAYDPAIAAGTSPPSGRAKRTTAQGIAPAGDRRSSNQLPAQRGRDSDPPPTRASSPGPNKLAEALRTDPDGHPVLGRAATTTNPMVTPLPTALGVDELFASVDAAAPADTLAMAADSAPVVAPADGGLSPLRAPPRTKPGVQPAPRPQQRASIAPATQKPVIGASMVERNQPRRRWPLVIGLVLIAGGGVAVAMFAMTGSKQTVKKPEPPPAPTGPGIVKFETEPADAEVRVEGQTHVGSPWSLELAAGSHQIEIHRSGYKAWLTSIELSARETQTFRVVLEPLGKGSATGDATLSVTTTPPDLEAWLDGQLVPHHTPLKMSIKPGTHTIVVKQNGAEVWRQTVEAEASSNYEFNPSFTAEKQRERAERAATPVAPQAFTVKRPQIAQHPTPEPAAEPAPAPEPEPVKPAEEPPAPVVPAPAPPVPMPAPPPPAPHPTPTPAPAPHPAGPVTVPPNAVTKVSGELPNIARFSKADLPPVAAAKLCIDTAGKVTSVELVSKLEHHIASDLTDAMRGWHYAPYRQAGAPVAACFVVTVRMK